ncbi:Glucose dehydrogenase [FAD, quinone] [Nymphon striatum]|nr:Glucose dehydrogenase [FAD, quinone] [Nymphon striatum]
MSLSIIVALFALLVYAWMKWINPQSNSIVSEPDIQYDFIIGEVVIKFYKGDLPSPGNMKSEAHCLQVKWKVELAVDGPENLPNTPMSVGGGTAGSVVAARLTENDKFRVLLIEAGGEESWMSRVPLLVAFLQTTEMNWGYRTTRQTHSMDGFNNNQAMCPRGKGLGGSSSINYMIHMRGVSFDYDNWRKNYNLDGWDYQSVLKYFMKSEQAPTEECLENRGCEGPLKLSIEDDQLGLGTILLNAGQEIKNSIDGIYDSHDGQGFSRSESNTYNGMRYGTAQAYLRPVMSRPNLHVMVHSRVTKILFNGIRAVGVRVENNNGKLFEPKALREVILSAGAISSPHLLTLSGVGPARKLKELGIEMVLDKPGVGSGLSDQLGVPIYFHLEENLSINAYKLKSFRQALKYLIFQKGYFSKTGVEVMGRISLDSLQKSNKTRNPPELLILALNIGSVDEELYTKLSNFRSESFQAIFPGSDNETKEGFILLSVCLHPKSRGSVRTISRNHQIPPVIDPQYLTNENDIDCLAQGYKFASILQKTTVMKNVGGKMHFPTHKECKKYPKDLRSKEYLRCLVRMGAMTSYHPVGTCSMGDKDMSVVDSHLRVHGLIGLRVVDGSVLPTQVSGTPHATIVMVAEKAADLIKSDNMLTNF